MNVSTGTSLRLGGTNAFSKWKMSWAATKKLYLIYLQKDYLIKRFIKALFFNYGVPLFTHKETRNDKSKKQKSGNENIIKNPFIESNISFSHITINRNPGIGINVFFVDAFIEEWVHKYTRRSKAPAKYIRLMHRQKNKVYTSKARYKKKERKKKEEVDSNEEVNKKKSRKLKIRKKKRDLSWVKKRRLALKAALIRKKPDYFIINKSGYYKDPLQAIFIPKVTKKIKTRLIKNNVLFLNYLHSYIIRLKHRRKRLKLIKKLFLIIKRTQKIDTLKPNVKKAILKKQVKVIKKLIKAKRISFKEFSLLSNKIEKNKNLLYTNIKLMQTLKTLYFTKGKHKTTNARWFRKFIKNIKKESATAATADTTADRTLRGFREVVDDNNKSNALTTLFYFGKNQDLLDQGNILSQDYNQYQGDYYLHFKGNSNLQKNKLILSKLAKPYYSQKGRLQPTPIYKKNQKVDLATSSISKSNENVDLTASSTFVSEDLLKYMADAHIKVKEYLADTINTLSTTPNDLNLNISSLLTATAQLNMFNEAFCKLPDCTLTEQDSDKSDKIALKIINNASTNKGDFLTPTNNKINTMVEETTNNNDLGTNNNDLGTNNNDLGNNNKDISNTGNSSIIKDPNEDDNKLINLFNGNLNKNMSNVIESLKSASKTNLSETIVNNKIVTKKKQSNAVKKIKQTDVSVDSIYFGLAPEKFKSLSAGQQKKVINKQSKILIKRIRKIKLLLNKRAFYPTKRKLKKTRKAKKIKKIQYIQKLKKSENIQNINTKASRILNKVVKFKDATNKYHVFGYYNKIYSRESVLVNIVPLLNFHTIYKTKNISKKFSFSNLDKRQPNKINLEIGFSKPIERPVIPRLPKRHRKKIKQEFLNMDKVKEFKRLSNLPAAQKNTEHYKKQLRKAENYFTYRRVRRKFFYIFKELNKRSKKAPVRVNDIQQPISDDNKLQQPIPDPDNKLQLPVNPDNTLQSII